MELNERTDLATLAKSLRKKVNTLLAVYGLMILLSFLVFAAVIGILVLGGWLMLESGRIYTRAVILGFIIIIAAIAALIAVLKPLFQIFRTTKPRGTEIKRKDYPDLFNLIDNVVEKVDCLSPKHVFISNECNAYVYNPSFLGYLKKKGRQNLTIGIPLLYGMNQTELTSILAHEFGHFTQRSVQMNRIANLSEFICGSILRSQEEMEHDSESSYARYAKGYVRFVGKVMLKQYHKVAPLNGILSRAQEFDADHFSQMVAGTEGSVSAMSKLSYLSSRWSGFYNKVALYERDAERAPEDVYESFRAYSDIVDRLSGTTMKAEERFTEPEKEFSSRLGPVDNTDTHPSYHERIDAIKGYDEVPTKWSLMPALALFSEDTIRGQYDSIRNEIQNKVYPNTTVFLKKDVSAQELRDDYKEALPLYLNVFYEDYIFFSDESFPKEECADSYRLNPFTPENAELVEEYHTAKGDLDTLEAINEEHSPETVFRYLGKEYNGTAAPLELHREYFNPIHERMVETARHCNWWLEEHAEQMGKGEVYYILRICTMTNLKLSGMMDLMKTIHYIGEHNIQDPKATEYVSAGIQGLKEALAPFMIDRGKGRLDINLVAAYVGLSEESMNDIRAFYESDSVTILQILKAFPALGNGVYQAREKAWMELCNEVILKG